MESTDWDEIYYFIQASHVTDPRYNSKNFDSQPVHILRNQIKSIYKRDKTIANSHSITVARCGLIFAGSDKLTEKDFLPFPELLENIKGTVNLPKILKSTARIFMDAVNSNELSDKVISAFSPHMDEICGLLE